MTRHRLCSPRLIGRCGFQQGRLLANGAVVADPNRLRVWLLLDFEG